MWSFDPPMKSQTVSNNRARLSRRWFLGTAIKAASVAVLGPSFLRGNNALAAGPVVRRNVGGLAAADPILLSYRKAIQAMQALPANNPLSWTYQAAIHGNVSLPPQLAWNTCEHGTYFFWSWHRMYLYWFEKIIRKMSGDNGWALPYWDWSSASQRQLPAPFRDTASELYTPNRNAAMNSGAGSLPASHVNYGTAFSFVNFTTASNSIQGTPHGAVHVDIGGWMGSVPTAAQDPIFYLHHSNVDRLWNLWLAQSGGRTDPLSDSTWKNKQFTFFDANGAAVKMTGCGVLRAAEQLSYSYESEPTEVKEYCLKPFNPWWFPVAILLHLPIPADFILGREPVSFSIDIKPIREKIVSISKSKSETLLLNLNRVETERQPGVIWEVYVGLPANAKADSEGPYYVGNIALFGAGVRSDAHHDFKPAEFTFPVERPIMRALKANEDKVQITFVPQGILVDGKPTQPKVESSVHIGEASLSVETQKRR